MFGSAPLATPSPFSREEEDRQVEDTSIAAVYVSAPPRPDPLEAAAAAFDAGDEAEALRIWYFEAGLKGRLGIHVSPYFDSGRDVELDDANENVELLIGVLASESPRHQVVDDIADDLVRRVADLYVDGNSALWRESDLDCGPTLREMADEELHTTLLALGDACGPDIDVYRQAVLRLLPRWVPKMDVWLGMHSTPEIERNGAVAFLLDGLSPMGLPVETGGQHIDARVAPIPPITAGQE